MNQSARRALRVSLTVAGMAVLCASFVGTAAASPSIDEATDPQVGNSSSELPAKPEVADGKLPSPDKVTDGLPDGVHNGVVDAQMPTMTIEGASYHPTGFVVVPASDPGNNEDEDDLCPGFNGEREFKNGNNFGNPCQTSGNNFKDGEVEVGGVPVAAPVSIPGVDADGGGTITPDGAAPLPDPNAVTRTDPNAVTDNLQAPKDLSHLNGQKVASQEVSTPV